MIDPAGKSKKKNEKKEDTSNEAIANAKVADNLDPYTRCLGYRYFGARNWQNILRLARGKVMCMGNVFFCRVPGLVPIWKYRYLSKEDGWAAPSLPFAYDQSRYLPRDVFIVNLHSFSLSSLFSLSQLFSFLFFLVYLIMTARHRHVHYYRRLINYYYFVYARGVIIISWGCVRVCVFPLFPLPIGVSRAYIIIIICTYIKE